MGELYIDIRKEYDKGFELYKKSLELNKSTYRLVTMITVLVEHYKDYNLARGYYRQLIQMFVSNKVVRDRYLKDEQWNAFLAAEQVLLG